MADMNNKLDNEEFRIVEIDSNVLSGDSNKLKLQLESRLAIMNVLEAFALRKQQEIIDAINVSDRNLGNEQRKLEELARILYIRIIEAQKYKERYTEISKKALWFPKENFDDITSLARILSQTERGQKREIANAEQRMNSISSKPLSKIDQTAVKESVEEAMRELIKSNEISDSKDIDSVVKEASKVGEKATQLYENKVTSNDMDKIFDSVNRKMHGERETVPVQDRPVNRSVFDGNENKMEDYFKKADSFENMDSKNVTVETENKDFVVPSGFDSMSENSERTVNFDETSFGSTKVDTNSSVSSNDTLTTSASASSSETIEKPKESQEIDFSNDNSLEEYLEQLDKLRSESRSMDDKLTELNEQEAKKKAESDQKAQEAQAKEDELIRVKKELLNSAKQQIQQYQTQVEEKQNAINNRQESIENYKRSIQDSETRIQNATDQIARWQSQLGGFTNGNSQTPTEPSKGHTK